jgi:hypothetical protein
MGGGGGGGNKGPSVAKIAKDRELRERSEKRASIAADEQRVARQRSINKKATPKDSLEIKRDESSTGLSIKY